MKLRLLLTVPAVMLAIMLPLFWSTLFKPDSKDASSIVVVDMATELHYEKLAKQVAPSTGLQIDVNWGDTGHHLVEAGAIDVEKLDALYGGLTDEQLRILDEDGPESITLNHENIRFWTNVLWSLGLTQKTKVLADGPMSQPDDVPLENFASTAGWILGKLPAIDLYNSMQIVTLTAEQDALVYEVAEHVFRPCCGNHTAFPDCNHGMAVLGLLALMASQGATEAELYEAALTFNSYAFTDAYITTAAYFTMQGIPWGNADASQILGPAFSSSRGRQQIASLVGAIPGTPVQSNNCSA